MKNSFFSITHTSKKSQARLGTLTTAHGVIQTPAFVPCATKGTLKGLDPIDIDKIGVQLMFANTYHLVVSPGLDVIEAAGGLHAFSGIHKPFITDSGGFQVFSLAREGRSSGSDEKERPHLVKITDDGVTFRTHTDGALHEFTPEFSIGAQKIIGADLIVAFDECTYLGATKKYTQRADARTFDWAKRSIETWKVEDGGSRIDSIKFNKTKQALYGVIQGGMYEDLRKKSATDIASLPFSGLAIGGVSVGETKAQMRDQVRWVMSEIGTDTRPRHLLGVGEVDDIMDMVKMGIDTFDCVIPTRHARMGKLYVGDSNNELRITNYGDIDIVKSTYKRDMMPIAKGCECYTCAHFTRAYLHHLFKQRELLAYRLASIHNLTFMEQLMKDIRKKIAEELL